MNVGTFRMGDLLVLALCLGLSLAIGVYFSRRQTGTDSFFLGNESMPGWLVGFSLTASMISAMSFLAIPGFTFKENYRFVLPSFSFLLLAIFAMIVLIPFFRQITTPSGYEFLERRFGTWARVYAAGGFLLFNLMRVGVVLYVTCLSLEIFFGIPAIWLMLMLGVVATLYTMAGGFEAVIWTEFFQAVILIAGALILLPVALGTIPGGVSEVIALAAPAGKLSFGSTELSLTEKTLWVMILSSLFASASDYTTRQDYIQRYRAPRSVGQARIAVAIGALTVVPIWLYFNFLGTVLWARYELRPDPIVTAFADKQPEKIVPYFMSTELPPILNSVVLAAILMASLSTLAPVLNACAVTWVSDFHQRFLSKGRDDGYYMRLGRWSTGVIGILMVLIAIWIHAARTQTLQDLQALGAMIFSAGLFGMFLVGFFSRRTGNRAALTATIITVGLVSIWVALTNSWVQAQIPALVGRVPDPFWIPVVSNLMLPILALTIGRWFPERVGSLEGLTLRTARVDPVPASEEPN